MKTALITLTKTALGVVIVTENRGAHWVAILSGMAKRSSNSLGKTSNYTSGVSGKTLPVRTVVLKLKPRKYQQTGK